VRLATGATVYEVGDEMDRLYFPSSGIASLQMMMKDGRAIDTAMVGRDGVLGPERYYPANQNDTPGFVRS